tara:strand:- start:390 stop:491 length:102 start_codon:yes stop_codon:yes gene_type:complete
VQKIKEVIEGRDQDEQFSRCIPAIVSGMVEEAM